MIASAFCVFVLHHALVPPSSAVSSCSQGCRCLLDTRYVNCSSGNFSAILTDLPSGAEFLDLSRNHVTEVLPVSFWGLLGLKVLVLKDNMISFVADGAFANLQSLHKLDLSQNRLSVLGDGFSVGLGSLRELVLAHNNLTILESTTFENLDNLVKLDLRANFIRYIKPRALSSMTALRQLCLNENHLTALGLGAVSSLRSLEVLKLQRNHISVVEPGVFSSLCHLTALNLTFNNLSRLEFKTFLSICASNVHVVLEGNPWYCDCDLQRVFGKLANIHRLFLDDYHRLRCSKPAELQGSLIVEVAHELCAGETVTVLILTCTVLITVVAAIIMGDKNKGHRFDKDWTEEHAGLDAYCES
ncbi:leucine-rich repeat-containing protein 15-like [Sphaeramia orbicularis]|uniref:Leucine-rich repeat-containing protein 15-like n=1 Tax=Sphaeramia orbicularis TaxID=375764 RepID=A0A673CTD9_9TELE|nr:leucine-rich repeat-containing protein 15-like [Sphaeramia orbicularis]